MARGRPAVGGTLDDRARAASPLPRRNSHRRSGHPRLVDRTRLVQVAAVAISLLAVFATEHATWTIPVLILAALIGGFSFRRTLYGETWTLGDYLPYVVASTV